MFNSRSGGKIRIVGFNGAGVDQKIRFSPFDKGSILRVDLNALGFEGGKDMGVFSF